MAYVLGYFAADGAMMENSRGAHFIEFHSTDKHLIMTVRRALSSNHKIGVCLRGLINPRHKTVYRLQIGSKEMFADLTAFGFVQNKSNSIRLPVIPSQYFGDFVRGYFDGDGCVYFKRLKFSDRKRMRWILMNIFTSGSKAFLQDLHTALKRYNIKGGSIRNKNRGFDLSFSHHDSLALSHLMYDTGRANGLYLPRKYKLFQRAIQTLYGTLRA